MMADRMMADQNWVGQHWVSQDSAAQMQVDQSQVVRLKRLVGQSQRAVLKMVDQTMAEREFAEQSQGLQMLVSGSLLKGLAQDRDLFHLW
jgi:hypothetical protein